MAVYTQASSEVLASGMEFEQQLTGAMQKALAFSLDDAFLNGNGVNRPLGVLNDPALLTSTRAAAGGITYPDIVNMYSRLHPALQQGAVWVANHAALPELLTMVDGNGNLIWSPDSRQGVSTTLLGKPVIFSEKLPTVGQAGDLLLANFSAYQIGMRKEIYLEKSNAPGWHRDTISFRAIVRCDGAGSWDQPMQPVNGQELSWCVTLEQ